MPQTTRAASRRKTSASKAGPASTARSNGAERATKRSGKPAKAPKSATSAKLDRAARASTKPSGSKPSGSKASGSKSSGLKTQQSDASVAQFLRGVADPTRRADCERLVKLMSRISGAPPKMWGASIVGFGTFHYKYASGREGDWPPIAFSPRKKDLTIYASPGLDHYKAELARLGTFTRGVSCLYVKRLADIDLPTLEMVLTDAFRKLTTPKA